MALPRVRAERLVAALELELDHLQICEACLSFVTFALVRGNEREIASATARLTPDLWAEGLALPALRAVEAARAAGVRDADAALDDLLRRGGRSGVARALVLRLAGQQRARDLLR